MRDQIAEALDKKEAARDARESGDLNEALTLIEAATKQLDDLWQQRSPSIDKAGTSASPDERDLVEALAETHGIKGGIYRSAGRPENAVMAYDRGLIFEQHAARKVDNSYNLMQRLTNRVLVGPELVGAPTWGVLSKDMWKELEDANRELRRQIATSRANDPWAAADLLTVQILLAPSNQAMGKQVVDEAWLKFESLKPKPFVYESTLRTLRDLKSGLKQVESDKRSEGSNTVAGLLDIVIQRFEEGFEKAKSR